MTQPTAQPYERKVLPAFVTNVNADRGIVEAIVSVFGVIDNRPDIIMPGAFRKTISERGRRVRVLDSHNWGSITAVLGNVLSLREVGRDELPLEVLSRWPEAQGGLKVEMQFLLDTPEGAGAFARIRSGAIDEYSFGFDVLQSAFEQYTIEGKPVTVRKVTEIRLWEVSPVIWGMNEATATVSVKSGTPDKPESAETENDDADKTQPLQVDVPTEEVVPIDPAVLESSASADEPSEVSADGLASILSSCVVSSVNWEISVWLKRGFVDLAEYALLANAAIVAARTMQDMLPGDLLTRVYDERVYADPSSWNVDSPVTERKSGRVLSAANAKRMRAAVKELMEIIAGAGLDLDDENTDADAGETAGASDNVGRESASEAEPLRSLNNGDAMALTLAELEQEALKIASLRSRLSSG